MPRRPPKQAVVLETPADLRGPLSPMQVAMRAPTGTLWRADALELLRSLADESVDLVVADPPYAIGKAAWDVFSSIDAYVDWCDAWLVEVRRILRPTGSAYVFGFSEILAEIKARSHRRFDGCKWLVWYYKNKANLGHDWGRSHESILHLRRVGCRGIDVDAVRIPYNEHTSRYPQRTQATSSQYSRAGRSEEDAKQTWQPHPLGAKPRDVLEVATLCNGMVEKTAHVTQKPTELIRKLILASSAAGNLVVDPFCGSGTTAAVAAALGRTFIAGDANAAYVGMARSRLQSAINSVTVAST